LADAIFWLAGRRELPPPPPRVPDPGDTIPDLADLRGHATPKLALCATAAGGHNLLFTGPPGTGKSAMLRRLPGLLPPLGPAERLAVLQVHAAAGLALAGDRRPLRAPHHTSSAASVLGGGADVRPGEVTLAHHGVLFLDELPEFRRDVLEALRQPLEDGHVTVGRAQKTVTMPAWFLLVAAMMGLGAVHKFRWVPQLRDAAEQVADSSKVLRQLARSIRFETLLAVVVLLITASMTSITGPQVG
jgi:magnesium chelatase family protein